MLLSCDPTNTNQYSELYGHIRFHTPYQTCTVPEHVFIAMGLECHFKLIFTIFIIALCRMSCNPPMTDTYFNR